MAVVSGWSAPSPELSGQSPSFAAPTSCFDFSKLNSDSYEAPVVLYAERKSPKGHLGESRVAVSDVGREASNTKPQARPLHMPPNGAARPLGMRTFTEE